MLPRDAKSCHPIAFPLRTMTLPSLFAEKIHALLCRSWGARVKGRDWYDCVWFLRKGVAVDPTFLEDKLRQSGHWREERPIGEEDLRSLYEARVLSLDVERARADLAPFLKDPASLVVWSRDFFLSLSDRFVLSGK